MKVAEYVTSDMKRKDRRSCPVCKKGKLHQKRYGYIKCDRCPYEYLTGPQPIVYADLIGNRSSATTT